MIATIDRVDAVLVVAFGRHASAPRHAALREGYRAIDRRTDFPTFLSRLYAAAWLVGIAVGLGSVAAVGRLPPSASEGVVATVTMLPLVDPPIADVVLRFGLPVVAGALANRCILRIGGRIVALRARRRRQRIEHSLPRTVRFMHVIAAGTADERTLFRAVAARERAFGETARSFRRVLDTAAVAGSLDRALRIVARDTPSRRTFAPFLLTLRERARDGPDSLRRFLHVETRTLARRDAQRTSAARRYFTVTVQLFLALLVGPALAGLGVGLLAGLGATDRLPQVAVATAVRRSGLLAPASVIAVLGLGALATGLAVAVRPPGYRWSRHRVDGDLGRLLRRAPRNPANAVVLLAPTVAVLAPIAWLTGAPLLAIAVGGYATVAVPTGLVDWRRSRIDAAKDRALPDLIYGIAHQVHRGRSFTEAVDHVAADGGLGALDPDVADLAFDLRVAATDRPVRAAALDRFVERVGTPLAERTVGMVAGALDAGGETAAAFDALQSEAGRLHHEERAVRDRMGLLVVVGWIVSLLLVGIVVAVDVAALGSVVPDYAAAGSAAVVPAGTPSFFRLTLATMLSAGWFAGAAGRGVYEGLLHSGALVLAAALAFAAAGLL